MSSIENLSVHWRPGAGYYALPFSSLEIAANAPRIDDGTAKATEYNTNSQDDS